VSDSGVDPNEVEQDREATFTLRYRYFGRATNEAIEKKRSMLERELRLQFGGDDKIQVLTEWSTPEAAGAPTRRPE